MRRPSDDELREQAERRRALAEHWGEHAEADARLRRLQMEKLMTDQLYPAVLARLKKGTFGVAQALKSGALEPEEAWAKLTTLFEEERGARTQLRDIRERIGQLGSLDREAMNRLANVLGRDALPEGLANVLPPGDDAGSGPSGRGDTDTSP